MRLIEKWKNRETKKKLREENIRLKAEIEAHMKTPYPVCTVDREIKTVKCRCTIKGDHIMPANVALKEIEWNKSEIAYKLVKYIEPFIEWDIRDDLRYEATLTGTLYVATGDRRYGKHE